MSNISKYLEHLSAIMIAIECSGSRADILSLDDSVSWACGVAKSLKGTTGKIMFVGNGGSMGIASHLAIDFTKNGGVPAIAFSDPAALTCVSNDLGYDQVFSRQIEVHGQKGDLLVAISSSGQSMNILNAVRAARIKGCDILTLSGFNPDNPLRKEGDINFYVPSSEYGIVEIAHMTIIHSILDIMMGWRTDE